MKPLNPRPNWHRALFTSAIGASVMFIPLVETGYNCLHLQPSDITSGQNTVILNPNNQTVLNVHSSVGDLPIERILADSPDRHYAIYAYRDSSLKIMNLANESVSAPLLADTHALLDNVWNSDSSRFAYVWYDAVTAHYRLAIIDADGSDPHTTSLSVSNPPLSIDQSYVPPAIAQSYQPNVLIEGWSYDGRYLAVAGPGPLLQIFSGVDLKLMVSLAVPIIPQQRSFVPDSNVPIVWSPTQNVLAFETKLGEKLYLDFVSADGTLHKGMVIGSVRVFGPTVSGFSWAADGQHLILGINEGDEVDLAGLDGILHRDVTRLDLALSWLIGRPQGGGVVIRLSNNTQQIVSIVATTPATFNQPFQMQISLFHVETGQYEVLPLINANWYDFSSDNHYLLIMSEIQGVETLESIDLNTNRTVRLPINGTLETFNGMTSTDDHHAWSPDGQWVALLEQPLRGAAHYHEQMVLERADGSQQRSVDVICNPSGPTLSLGWMLDSSTAWYVCDVRLPDGSHRYSAEAIPTSNNPDIPNTGSVVLFKNAQSYNQLFNSDNQLGVSWNDTTGLQYAAVYVPGQTALFQMRLPMRGVEAGTDSTSISADMVASPNGKEAMLLIRGTDDENTILLGAASGQMAHLIATIPATPSLELWSPDGKWFVLRYRTNEKAGIPTVGLILIDTIDGVVWSHYPPDYDPTILYGNINIFWSQCSVNHH